MDKAHAYARQRARDTGRPYLVTDQGHVMLYCRQNARVAREIGCTIVAIFR